MKKILKIFTNTLISAAVFLGVASLSGCSLNFAPSKSFSFSSDRQTSVSTVQEAYFKTLNFQGYKYPIEEVLGPNFSKNEHYQIRIVDECTGTQAKHYITQSNKNEIGNRNAVSDDNIFELNGKNLVYASFNDDWSIKETVEPVFDSQGVLEKTVTVRYNQNGTPISYSEQ